MERLIGDDCDLKLYNALTLAYVGDSVFELMVREKIACEGDSQIGKINARKVKLVCCQNQAEAMKKLIPILTEEEETIYKRGRNAHSKPPRNASVSDYKMATGFETLMGYLYLKNDILRLREIFTFIYEN